MGSGSKSTLRERTSIKAIKERRIRNLIAGQIEEARVEKALTVRAMAKLMGTKKTQVQRLRYIEKSGSVTLRSLIRAAEALDLELVVSMNKRGKK